MRIIESGGTYRVFNGDAVNFMDTLPAAVFNVEFDRMSGYSLVKTDDLDVNEKLYGKTTKNAQSVINLFESVDRSVGAILSGTPGMGKTMMARYLSKLAIQKGIPTIVISDSTPGLVPFLNGITQPIMVLFDEFEKVFNLDDDDVPTTQSAMLPLFDGLDNNKKLFIVTCNDVRRLSRYMLNRPGRFHYHFRFTEVDADIIREYLEDNMTVDNPEAIDDAVAFGRRIEMTYDYLRALAVEINLGNSVRDAIEYINVETPDYEHWYDIVAEAEDGKTYITLTELNLDTELDDWFRFRSETNKMRDYHYRIDITTNKLQMVLNRETGVIEATPTQKLIVIDEDTNKPANTIVRMTFKEHEQPERRIVF